MDFVFRLIDISLGYYLAAVVIVIVVGVFSKKWTYAFLIGYMFLVLADTVLIRRAGQMFRFELLPFWSYRDYFNGTDPTLMKQILANVIMFIPIGVLLGRRIGWKGLLVAAGLSIVIEVLQLVSQRGLCEFDDVIHNTIGALIGVGVVILFDKISRVEEIE